VFHGRPDGSVRHVVLYSSRKPRGRVGLGVELRSARSAKSIESIAALTAGWIQDDMARTINLPDGVLLLAVERPGFWRSKRMLKAAASSQTPGGPMGATPA
jgi:hypothetical protein